MDPGPQPHGANSYARTLRILHLLRMQKMTYDFLQMGINPETAGILIVHMVQVLYQTVAACQDKPDKMREIKETFDTMGLPFILNHIDVENILRMNPGAAKGVQSGGSPRMTPAQFMSSMGIKPNKSSPLFRKMSRPTKKRGGARGEGDCGGKCDSLTPCQNAACLNCVNGRCRMTTARQSQSRRRRSSSPVEDVPPPSDPHGVVGLVVRQNHSNPAVLELAIRSNTAQKMLEIVKFNKESEHAHRDRMVDHFTDTTTKSLNSASEERVRAEGHLVALNKQLLDMVTAKRKDHDAEFDALLSSLEKELKSLVVKERIAGAVGAVAGVAAVKLCAKLLDKTAGGLYTFIYWILLAGQSVLNHVPFVSRVVSGTFDTQCFGSPLPSPFDGAIFPTLVQTNNTATTYDYTWQYYPGSAAFNPKQYVGQNTCPDNSLFGYKVGDCVAKNGFELITTCTTAGIQFFSSDVDVTILTMILGSVVGALFFYLTYRICTLQTPVLELATLGKKKRRGTDWLGPLRLPGNMLKDALKVSLWATLAGAYIDAMFSSTDRQQLKENVDNKEVTYGDEDHPVNRAEFHSLQDAHFKKSLAYTQKMEAIATAQKRLAAIDRMLLKLLKNNEKTHLQIMDKMLKYTKLQHADTALAQFIPAIMNGTDAPVEFDGQQQQLLLQDGTSSSNSSSRSSSRHSSSSPSSSDSSPSSSDSRHSSSSPSSSDSSPSQSPSSSDSSPSPSPPKAAAAAAAADAAAAAARTGPPGKKSKGKTRREGGRRKRGTRQSIRRRLLSRRRK